MPNNSRPKSERCAICGKAGLLERHVTRSYGRGAALLVIEHVPVHVCPHCGESYLSADTLHELARIKRHRRSLAAPKRVAVASFT
jgi:YgiT-type zinc finger domain-containing protein